MSNQHKVKIWRWDNEVLVVDEITFYEYDRAQEFALGRHQRTGEQIKIYNFWDEIILEIAPKTNCGPGYA